MNSSRIGSRDELRWRIDEALEREKTIGRNEILELIDQWVAEVIGEDEPESPVAKPKRGRPRKSRSVEVKKIYLSNVFRNQFRAQQRAKAGLNEQTKDGRSR